MTTSLAGRVDIADDSPWARRDLPATVRATQPAFADITPAGPTFDELYAAQYARMVRLAHSLVDTRQRAEEIAQDAFAAVYERYDRLANPTAYLRACVLNGCRRAIRRRMLRRSREQVGGDSGAELTFNHVLDAVRRLPHRQRSMIALRYDLQLTDAEIAAALDVPLGTVKSTLFRALTTLRKEIEK